MGSRCRGVANWGTQKHCKTRPNRLPPGVPRSKALNGGFWGLWEGGRVSTSNYRDTPPTLGIAGVFTLGAGLLLLAFFARFLLGTQ